MSAGRPSCSTISYTRAMAAALGSHGRWRFRSLERSEDNWIQGAKWEANSDRFRATSGHVEPELAALAAGARQMRHFLPALITGLLQTPEYMRAAMDTPVEPAAGDTTAAIALKLERQAILHDKSKDFEFLLTESALRWQLCEPSVMAVQLDRLVSPSRLPNIRIGVLPFGIQVGDGPYHTFVIYDDHIVTIELFTG